MKRLAMGSIGVASIAAACLIPSPAPAQQPYVPGQAAPYSPPPYSPYLNLLRPGNQAINYYGLVRPQIAFTNSIVGLQSQLNAVGAQVTEGQQVQVPLVTGHPTAFMNYTHYFGGAAGRPGAGPARPPVAGAAAAPAAHPAGVARPSPPATAH